MWAVFENLLGKYAGAGKGFQAGGTFNVSFESELLTGFKGFKSGAL